MIPFRSAGLPAVLAIPFAAAAHPEVINVNILKAFAEIGPLAINTPGVVAPIGELAPISRTFSREKSLNSFQQYVNTKLVTFSYKVDGVPATISAAIAQQVLNGVYWTHQQAQLGAFNETKDSFQQKFITQFGATFDLIDSGAMIASGNYWYPEYITFAPKGASTTISWRVWFADASFQNQYDEYEIDVVPPIINIDQFFNDAQTVKGIIDGIDIADIFKRCDDVKALAPETVIRLDKFDWVEKGQNGAQDIRLPTPWATVIYGWAGDNLDARKEAIRDYILSHSEHTRDEWAEIFPDLFTSTEMIIIPRYDLFSIPNATRDLGIYSPTVDFVGAMNLAHKLCKGVKYTDAHIDSVISSTTSLYRSLALCVVGGPENRNGIDTFYEKYPDYINVPTTHVDFMRMNEATRKFVLLLTDMLQEAEAMTPNTGVPREYNRLTRDGVVYLATTYDNFLWLVVTKYSVDAANVVPDA